MRVDVTCLALTSADVELRFAVHDTGIGIPEARQKSIFRPFEQEDMSTTRRYGGTGLGLTIAARFVEMMGGAITVASTPQRGSTFTFSVRFPRAESSSEPRLEQSRPHLDEPPPISTAPLRVLVAEDNPFNSLLLEKLLTSRGHVVRLAHDGAEALAQAKSGGFDLLLLDLHMPELDGFQVIEALREHERTAGGHLPTIALTARSRAEDRARCFAAGVDDFLAKPIRAATLWSAIERVSASRGFAKVTPPVPLVSAEVLLATCGGSAEVLDAVRGALVRGFPSGLEAITRGFEARDASGVREAAHKMSGMLAAFSTTVAAVASALEDIAATGELRGGRELYERLRVLGPELLAEVERVSIESLTERR